MNDLAGLDRDVEMCEHVWKEKLLDHNSHDSSVIQIDKCAKCGDVEICFSVASYPGGRRSYNRRVVQVKGATHISSEGKDVKLT